MDSIMSWVEAVKGSQTDSIFASALRFNISKLEDFTCHVTDSLAAVVHKLAINRLHQLFVVDENGCLLSQITLRDIIKRMVDQSMWA